MGVDRIGKPAIFIDRDGTIIHQVELLHKPSQMKLFAGSARAIKAFNNMGYKVIMVTNQPVVARGLISFREADHINKMLVDRLVKRGAVIDAAYFCPHHPNATVKKYRIACACRKPNPGMLLEAAKKLHISLKKSFMIGDSTRDVLSGKRAKTKMILVKTGHGGKDNWQFPAKPDFIAKDLLDAAKIVRRMREKK